MSCIPINDFSLITLCDATKAGKLYSIVPSNGDGDFDVTRASTATYLGSDGLLKTAATDEPRIEFNPDGSYKGLLVEPAATNLLQRSEEFDDGSWTKSDVTVTANDAVAPDGNTTADRLVENSTNNIHRINRITNTADNIQTFSVFAKLDSQDRYIQLRLQQTSTGNRAVANFDLFTGQVLDSGFFGDYQSISASIVDFGNGWYRCVITASRNVVSVIQGHNIYLLNEANKNNIDPIPSYLGDGTSGVFLWGAQLETGPVATSYIPTVASTVTRAADVISRTGASALIGQTEGSLYVDFIWKNTGGIIKLLNLTDDSFAEVVEIDILTNEIRGRILSQTVTIGNIQTPINEGRIKVCYTYKNNEFGLYVNGNLINKLTTGVITPLDDKFLICLGVDRRLDRAFLNSHIKAVALLPTAISEQAAINLTS